MSRSRIGELALSAYRSTYVVGNELIWVLRKAPDSLGSVGGLNWRRRLAAFVATYHRCDPARPARRRLRRPQLTGPAFRPQDSESPKSRPRPK